MEGDTFTERGTRGLLEGWVRAGIASWMPLECTLALTPTEGGRGASVRVLPPAGSIKPAGSEAGALSALHRPRRTRRGSGEPCGSSCNKCIGRGPGGCGPSGPGEGEDGEAYGAIFLERKREGEREGERARWFSFSDIWNNRPLSFRNTQNFQQLLWPRTEDPLPGEELSPFAAPSSHC